MLILLNQLFAMFSIRFSLNALYNRLFSCSVMLRIRCRYLTVWITENVANGNLPLSPYTAKFGACLLTPMVYLRNLRWHFSKVSFNMKLCKEFFFVIRLQPHISDAYINTGFTTWSNKCMLVLKPGCEDLKYDQTIQNDNTYYTVSQTFRFITVLTTDKPDYLTMPTIIHYSLSQYACLR